MALPSTHCQLRARRRSVSRVRRAVNRAMCKRANHSTSRQYHGHRRTDAPDLSHPGDGCSHRPAAHSPCHIQTRLTRRGDATPTSCNKLQCCLGAFITSTDDARGCPRLDFHTPSWRPAHRWTGIRCGPCLPRDSRRQSPPMTCPTRPPGGAQQLRVSMGGCRDGPSFFGCWPLGTARYYPGLQTRPGPTCGQKPHPQSRSITPAPQPALCCVCPVPSAQCPPKGGGGGVGARLPEVPTFPNVTHRTTKRPPPWCQELLELPALPVSPQQHLCRSPPSSPPLLLFAARVSLSLWREGTYHLA